MPYAADLLGEDEELDVVIAKERNFWSRIKSMITDAVKNAMGQTSYSPKAAEALQEAFSSLSKAEGELPEDVTPILASLKEASAAYPVVESEVEKAKEKCKKEDCEDPEEESKEPESEVEMACKPKDEMQKECTPEDMEKREWNQEARDKLSRGEIEGGFAGPDQSFPIASPADVGDAWGLAGHADDPDAVRARIKAIARKHGWESGLPEAARKRDESDEPEDVAPNATTEEVQKMSEETSTVQLPPEVVAQLEELKKQNESFATELQKARDEATRRDWLEKARGVSALPVKAEELADQLVFLAKSDAARADWWMNTLSAVANQLQDGGLFAETGTSTVPEGTNPLENEALIKGDNMESIRASLLSVSPDKAAQYLKDRRRALRDQ
jgi:hypothetical protein